MLLRESVKRKDQISVNVNFTVHNRNVFFLRQVFFALKKGRRRRSKCDRDTGGATIRVGESQRQGDCFGT